MESDTSLSASSATPSLCYRCRRISLATVAVLGGFLHTDRLEEIVESASQCAMCALIRDGLFADIADKFEDDLDTVHSMISVRPDVYCSSMVRHKMSFQAGLRVWTTLSSPIRPEGLQKLDVAKAWLRESVRYFDRHDAGKRLEVPPSANKTDYNIAPKSFPRRLLNLGSEQYNTHGDIRLVSYRPGLPYLSLSHRWGNSQHLITTRSNYLLRMLCIRFAELPKTFQDAIIVARYLGVQYLWIDALCIIQDDEVDWHREALIMGTIYQSAACTIAVHDAIDDNAGFLENSLRPPVSVLLGSVLDGTDSTVSLRSNFRAAVDSSGLSKRGWVLQERFLSNRTIHFTERSIFFEDGHGVISEEDVAFTKGSSRLLKGPTNPLSVAASSAAAPSYTSGFVVPISIGTGKTWGDPSAEYEGQLSERHWPRSVVYLPKELHIRPFNHRAWNSSRVSFEIQWFELLEKYSNTDLTFESDKLPAISGLVKSFQMRTNDCFIGGLWRNTFHIGLLWAAYRSPLRRPKLERALSWSWTSVDGSIQHPRQPDHQLQPLARFETDISFQEAEITNNDLPLILEARMRLLDRLELTATKKAPLFFRRSVNVHQMFGTKIIKPLIWFTPEKIEEERQKCRPGIGVIGFAVLDDGNAHEEAHDFWCVEIARDQARDQHTWVLLVTPSFSAAGHWRRVGMGCIQREQNEEPWFDGIGTTRIVLV